MKELKHIRLVDTYSVQSEKNIKHHHSINLGNGYEGTMIRHGNKGYEINSRSYTLLKYKDFLDMDCEVVDVIPSDARPDQGIIVCILPNKQLVKANLKFTHKERAEILKDKDQYIGKIANLRYFETTDDGNLRFPVCIGFHEDR